MVFLRIFDWFLGFLMSLFTAFLMVWIVGPEWNGFLSMIFGMVLGMAIPCLFLFIPIPFLADFEVMIPGMVCAMVTGMIIGMMIPVNNITDQMLVFLSGGITVLTQITFSLFNKRVHGYVINLPTGGNADESQLR